MLTHYTDASGCVRGVSTELGADGVRRERDLLTRQGRKAWGKRVALATARKDVADREDEEERAAEIRALDHRERAFALRRELMRAQIDDLDNKKGSEK